MKLPILTLMVIAANAAFAVDPQVGSGETDGYRLVWQDLFDADALSSNRWYIEANGDGGGNNELQYYSRREENVRLGDDGEGNHCLILTARREEFRGRHFTSGRINSRELFAFTHGKIEAAIKLPKTANGLWPAFWMMGNDHREVGWPRCGEIDILEMGNATGISTGFQEQYFNGACHWGPGWPNASYANAVTKSYSLQDGEYHLYTLIWDEDYLSMYVDLDRIPRQTPYFRMSITCDDPGNEWSAGNYFHKNNFILFNLAVGGNFPGIHNAEGITALNDENGQQASMYVNYVKVYQKGIPGEDIFMLEPGDDPQGVISVTSPDAVEWDVTPLSVSASVDSPMALYDTAGRLVASSSEAYISLEGLAPGIYIVKVSGFSRKIAVK
ncbi:MAG: family 16 glycosylhydrolase [Odoribacter sp.]|nr:family 16 glycosylhydrolase [Odoribacter sp.]